MGKDYKVGLICGLVVAIVASVWVATRPSLSPEARMLRSSKAAAQRNTPPVNAAPPTTDRPPPNEHATGAPLIDVLPALAQTPAAQADPDVDRPQAVLPSPVAKQAAAEPQPEAPDLTIYEKPEKIKTTRFHIVRKDETLSAISQQYYGSPNKWRHILEANEAIKDANKIRPGMKLIIPE